MSKIPVFFSILVLSSMIFTACNQQEPVTQEPLALYPSDQADALYLLGNDEPVEAEQPSNFLLNGPGPFFLWALDLTDDQRDQLLLIGEEYRSEMRSLFHEMMQNRDWELIREAHEALREEMFKEIMNILTDEQKAILEEIQAQIDAGQYPTIVIDKRLATLTYKLNLTEEQQDSVRNLMEIYGAELLRLRDQRQDPRTMHEQSRQILDEYISAFKAILDEEQLVIFKEMQSEFRANHPHRPHPGRHMH